MTPSGSPARPARPRVIGLAYAGSPPLLKTRPFLQTFAYAQVARGGTLNFSFAEFAPSLVVYTTRPRWPWTGLEWFPNRVRAGDFANFDYALINAAPELHQRLAERFPPRPGHERGHIAPLCDAGREAAGMSRWTARPTR
jgi:hypothetical protein